VCSVVCISQMMLLACNGMANNTMRRTNTSRIVLCWSVLVLLYFGFDGMLFCESARLSVTFLAHKTWEQ